MLFVPGFGVSQTPAWGRNGVSGVSLSTMLYLGDFEGLLPFSLQGINSP